ncbi:MAG: DUF1127 domain-containing protein [Rhodobacteraceae bacterium]|nr:DUF1127 domain-containing protein [Paracoccaceae bacterium]
MAISLTHSRTTQARRFRLVRLVSAAFAAWRQRRALSTLDAHARRDLGLSEGDVHIESARPIWDVPHNWRL